MPICWTPTVLGLPTPTAINVWLTTLCWRFPSIDLFSSSDTRCTRSALSSTRSAGTRSVSPLPRSTATTCASRSALARSRNPYGTVSSGRLSSHTRAMELLIHKTSTIM
uniref:(northern house mosquito) hypothetical protein n=1 Tax=Culex pipiens TaxID=7175 RepID=A0A8D8P9A3_CULPI